MPYRLEQSGSGWYVVGPSGRHSRRPLARSRAEAQLRALYAAERKESAVAPVVTPPHGPGGLLAPPGQSGGRRRKWGARRKESRYTFSYKATGAPGEKIAPGVTRIRGNLCNVHGRYGPCDQATGGDRRPTAPGFGPKKPKKRAKPKKSDAEREAERAARLAKRDSERRATRDKLLTEAGMDTNLQGALTDAREGNTLTEANGDRLAKLGLAEQAADGSYRLSAAGRAVIDAALGGDAGRVRDTLSSAQDRAGKRAQADAARRAREMERAAREEARKKKGGGGGKTKPSAAETARARETARQDRQAAREQERQATQAQRLDSALTQTGVGRAQYDALRTLAEGGALPAGTDTRALQESGLLSYNDASDRLEASDQGRRALRALANGNVVEYQAALQDARARMAREAAARESAAQRREQAFNRPPRVVKSFAVVKDARGKLRWIARSTTAFRDRDGEIISTRALTRDAERMTRTKQYGPLRYWHVGTPDPNASPPWGPGIDLGMCDYSTVIGRTAIESGTFFDDAIGTAFAESADDYELSPGFFHPYTSGPPDRVYDEIQRFERSPIPVRYGRASNYFTGLTIKEERMDPQEIARRKAAFKADMTAKGVPAAAIDAALAGWETAEKSADAQQAAYKNADAPTVYTGPDGAPGLIVDGRWVALKAAMPPTEMMAAGTTEAADGAAEEATEEPAAGDEAPAFVGDLSVDEFKALLRGVLQEMGGALVELDQKMAAMGYERKTKEAEQAATVTTLTEQIAGLTAHLKSAQEQLAALQGDAPRGGYRPSLDGQEDARTLTEEQLAARRKALGDLPKTGDPAVDAVIAWRAGTPFQFPGVGGNGTPNGTPS